MKYCISCGAKNEDHANVCIRCGNPFNQEFQVQNWCLLCYFHC